MSAPADLTIRAAVPADAGAIARLHVATWRDTYAGILPDTMLIGMSREITAERWRSTIAAAAGGSVLVAERAGAVAVGFASYGRGRAIPGAPARRLAQSTAQSTAQSAASMAAVGEKRVGAFPGAPAQSATQSATQSVAQSLAQPAAEAPVLPVGEVFTLYVGPDHQDKGIGRALLARCFASMIGDCAGSATLWVLADNPSRFFYRRCGGRPVAERTERLWGSDVAEICYGWDDLAAACRAMDSRAAKG